MLRNTAVIVCAVAFLTALSSSALSAQNFRVQVAAFADSVPMVYFLEKGLDQVVENIDQDGIYRYFAGDYNTRDEAEKRLQQVLQRGFRKASIIDQEEQRALCGLPCPFFHGNRTYTEDKSLLVRNVYFDSGKSMLSEESRAEIDRVFTILKNNSQARLEILGHADAQGSPEYNIELAKRRSRAVRNYLIVKGIHADRQHIKVFGELAPERPNHDDFGKDSPEGRRFNRRVVLVVIDPTGQVQEQMSIGTDGTARY